MNVLTSLFTQTTLQYNATCFEKLGAFLMFHTKDGYERDCSLHIETYILIKLKFIAHRITRS
jgi:hypothetical protein